MHRRMIWRDWEHRVPALVVLVVVVGVCLVQALISVFPDSRLLSYVQRLEWITYDLRTWQAVATHREPPAACLGAVFIDQESLATVNRNYGFSWPWPRQMHGRLISELKEQGAVVVGFDVLFEERAPLEVAKALAFEPHNSPAEQRLLAALAGSNEPEYLAKERLLGSDGYLAVQMLRAGNVVLGTMGQLDSGMRWVPIEPHPLFATNALRLAHLMAEPDADGVLRRARACYQDPRTGRRYWQLGLTLAAEFLQLDLDRARFVPGAIEIPGRPGAPGRTIPVDRDGAFYVDWSVPDRDMKQASYQTLLQDELKRSNGKTNLHRAWRNKLVVVGSAAAGNNVSDLGATPLSKQTLLVSKHWNVANQLIQGRFIRRSGYATETVLIVLVGVLSGIITWRLRVLWASLLVVALLLAYVLLAMNLFIFARYWLPVTLPIGGALLVTHMCLVTYRVAVEQKERTRVRSVFSRVVSPDVVNELLKAEDIALGGTRRTVTVFFADIRGFTTMTDEGQARAEAYVQSHGLTGAAAEDHLEAQAREILTTVNLYLGIVADTIRTHQGTFDKYIGDCAMAFWGAPVPNEDHAVACVKAAVEAQRRIYQLNAERAAENRRRETENALRRERREPELPPLTLLALGSGINTGVVTVGLMGSDKHTLNYTVFGREVNLASRLEGISGRGRILISDSTYQELRRHSPELADACLGLPPVAVKGFREPVRVYEVQWRRLGDGGGYDTGLVTGTVGVEARPAGSPEPSP